MLRQNSVNCNKTAYIINLSCGAMTRYSPNVEKLMHMTKLSNVVMWCKITCEAIFSTWKCLLHRQYLQHLRQLWCMVYQSTLEDSATGVVQEAHIKLIYLHLPISIDLLDWSPVLNENKNKRKRRLGWIMQKQSSISCTTLIDHLF